MFVIALFVIAKNGSSPNVHLKIINIQIFHWLSKGYLNDGYPNYNHNIQNIQW